MQRKPDHRDFIRSLPQEQRRALIEKSDIQGLVHLTGHWGLVALLGWLIAVEVPFWPLLMLAQGILLVFLFTLLHETSHRTVFEKVWLNKAVAAVCGFSLALPPEWFRYFHFDHHRYTQDPEKDPELASPKPETWRQYVIHVSGLPVWKSHVQTLFRNAMGRCTDSYVPESGRRKVQSEAQAMIALYVLAFAGSVAAGSPLLLFVWIVPLLLGQPFLRLYLMAEHGKCPFVANMFENTRTTFTNPLMLKLAWNMPYHAEHHALAAVPFHKLPEFHRLTAAHLQVTERGYSRFHRAYIGGLNRTVDP